VGWLVVNEQLEIRSFRAVFALERRIYRIDTLRLNPGGVPLRGIGYAVALVLLALAAGSVPPTSFPNAVIPWYVRDVAAPLCTAVVLATLRIDGRPFHIAVGSLCGFMLGARRLHSLAPASRQKRWAPADVLLIPDGSEASLRSMRFRGPGAVLVQVGHVAASRSGLARADLVLTPTEGQSDASTVVELQPGAVLEVRAH
jgi:hypothetical protein